MVPRSRGGSSEVCSPDRLRVSCFGAYLGQFALDVRADRRAGAEGFEASCELVRVPVPLGLRPSVPAVRRGHHYSDLARGYVMAGDHAGGLRCLEQARRIAPQQTRHHPMVRETVLAIAAARRGREELSLFASWLGLG
jgi:hypothetical protein